MASEPTVAFLVRDLADETSGWLQAEVSNLRREVDTRFDEARITAVRLAIGLLFAALGLQLLLAALVVWLAVELQLGWTVALGTVGITVSLIGLRALVAARARAPR